MRLSTFFLAALASVSTQLIGGFGPANAQSFLTKAYQLRLSQEGFYSSEIDGIDGQGTSAAWAAYQRHYNLETDEDVLEHMFYEAQRRRTEVTDGQKSTAENALEDELKDAESARTNYHYSYPIPNQDTVVVCGEVNSKNSYGAYVGYTPFHVSMTDFGDDKYIYIIADFGDSSEAICLFGTHWGARSN